MKSFEVHAEEISNAVLAVFADQSKVVYFCEFIILHERSLITSHSLE